MKTTSQYSDIESEFQSLMTGINFAIKEIKLSQEELNALTSVYKKCEEKLAETTRRKKLKINKTTSAHGDKTTCSICGATVNKKNLEKHKKRVHSNKNAKQLPEWEKLHKGNDLFVRGKVVSGGGFGVGKRKRS